MLLRNVLLITLLQSVTNPQCGTNCTVRCTRINSDRYKLGRKQQGFYWKLEGSYPSAGRGGAKQIKHHELPAALKPVSRFNVEKDGCVGAPFGSLLVEKSERGCGGYYYRPLLFLNGEPVRIYPECNDLAYNQEGLPRCLND